MSQGVGLSGTRAGDDEKRRVIDKDVVRQAQVFVACLPCSDLTYAEASWTQGHEDWLGAHVRAFAYIGGCPKKVIPIMCPGT